jgi:penicillin-binding protein 1B
MVKGRHIARLTAAIRRVRIHRFGRYLVPSLVLVAILAAGFTLYLDRRVTREFEGRRFALPARIYARPLELHAGLRIRQAIVEQELRELGYRDQREGETGWYERGEGILEIATRPFVFWDGLQPAQRVRVRFTAGRVTGLADAQGNPLALARLEPLAIGGIYASGNEDRSLARLDEGPWHLVEALIAIEDRRYFAHHGFDLRGLARAARSLVTSERVQGGSTLTQQLVKNFFLTPERTVTRKLTEIVMAVLLELHYDKKEILETYLNEIYLGQDRDRAIHGVGLAAQFYFGKPVAELNLPEAALLVGILKGPAYYDPYRHAGRALERRNLVLTEMRALGSISAAVHASARAAPLGLRPKAQSGTSPYPAFLQLVHRQLREDYADADLRNEGLRVFTTLDPRAQRAAESALARRLAQYDEEKRFVAKDAAGKERGDKERAGLEGAIVVTDSQSGEVQALVGGREPRYRGYNRALDATRPVGSLLKPAIYLTALSEPARYTLATPIDDGPFIWKSQGAKDWQPANYDKRFHGSVPLRTALANSYNAAAARLGTELGVERVLENARRLGIARHLEPYAASLLGAVDMSPLEVAQMYQTIASGGFRTPLVAIREVTTQDGKPLKRYALAVEQAFPPEPIYLLTAAMQDVVREGTAAELQRWVAADIRAAGKTGTTDEQRDAWFAGFTGDRLGVVWIGYDDNRAARLTGASAALPVWGDLMASLDPAPLELAKPDGIEFVSIDPQSGLRGGAGCAGARELPFIEGSAPRARAPCADPLEAAGEAIERAVSRAKSFLERLFGR